MSLITFGSRAEADRATRRVRAMHGAVRGHLPESVGRYIVAVGRRTREIPGVELGVSSRAMIHLVNASKANARLNGRGSVTIEDVREMAPFVLRHRISVADGMSVDTVLLDAMAGVPSAVPPPISPVS